MRWKLGEGCAPSEGWVPIWSLKWSDGKLQDQSTEQLTEAHQQLSTDSHQNCWEDAWLTLTCCRFWSVYQVSVCITVTKAKQHLMTNDSKLATEIWQNMDNRIRLNPSIDQHMGDSDAISSYHIYASFFLPFCGASSMKCILLWYHFHSKIVIIQTFS